MAKTMQMAQMAEQVSPQLTFGEKAVGLTFNPSNDPEVEACKRIFAAAIDQMNALRLGPSPTPGQKRHASIAIAMIEEAQMRAVKALTWRE